MTLTIISRRIAKFSRNFNSKIQLLLKIFFKKIYIYIYTLNSNKVEFVLPITEIVFIKFIILNIANDSDHFFKSSWVTEWTQNVKKKKHIGHTVRNFYQILMSVTGDFGYVYNKFHFEVTCKHACTHTLTHACPFINTD